MRPPHHCHWESADAPRDPPRPPLAKGGSAALSPCLPFSLSPCLFCALACLLLAGCGSGSAEPQLAVSAVAMWTIPSEGLKAPSPRAAHVGLKQELFVLD